MRHKLLEKSKETLVGVCQVCGPVDLYHRKDRDYLVCRNSTSASGRERDRISTAGHGLTKSQAHDFKRDKVCWICGTTDRLVVDHCHETGKIRGVLCANHNAGLGLFKDNPLHLERAMLYLSVS